MTLPLMLGTTPAIDKDNQHCDSQSRLETRVTKILKLSLFITILVSQEWFLAI